MADRAEALDEGQPARAEYQRRLLAIRGGFEAAADQARSGAIAIAGRSEAMDGLMRSLWGAESARDPRLGTHVCVVGVGGYGRRELFPSSDVDVLFLLDERMPEREARDAIRRVSQRLWDAGARVSPLTRGLAECVRLDPENVEATLALMDARLVCGDGGLFVRFGAEFGKVLAKESKTVARRLAELVRARYARYGETLFHLEPNVKDCPGGLRDVHLCGWMARLGGSGRGADGRSTDADGSGDGGSGAEFEEAFQFLSTVRCFLHYRRQRDDNTLDWQAQDEAAGRELGAMAGQGEGGSARPTVGGDASYWMRLYFRHARIVNRRATQALAEVLPGRASRLARLRRPTVEGRDKAGRRYRLEGGRASLDPASERTGDPAREPDVVLGLFAEMTFLGFTLSRETEERLSRALPSISAHLEEGPGLWHRLREILTGRYAGQTLRSMHALGLLELLIPEFHGIDALVVRDAYHRYTVDEHTFVAIDTLHALEVPAGGGERVEGGAAGESWTLSFAKLLRDLPHPELLYLATLLHDTGKGRQGGQHAAESERMARSMAGRLELDAQQTELVAGLVRHHLEMSAALRRDIFDGETVRGFAGKVMTPEALRMLTLFTYADINAVHPDALTPWKAENLWRLYMATANHLDRSVDEERVAAAAGGELAERVVAFAPERRAEVQAYLEGFPERYLRTRTAEQIWTHFEMSSRFAEDPVQLHFKYAAAASEVTLVTRDREFLFATMTGVLAGWGMNIVTADAFSNARGVVVDSFRFTDSFRTLEMNASERAAFVRSAHDVLLGKEVLDRLLAGRKRGRRRTPKVRVTPKVDFDAGASSQSSLVQVLAQDTPGLLRALSLAIAGMRCNVEVALVDTEGEMAIDVFYLTRDGAKLSAGEQVELRARLLEAMEEHGR